MTTIVTKTIKPSGGDYSSLSAFEAGEAGDLVAADKIVQAECYAFQDPTPVTFGGAPWVTDAAHYIRVYTPKSERHNGTWGTGYRLYHADGPWWAIDIGIECRFIRFEGIAIKVNYTNSDPIGSWWYEQPDASDIRLEKCLLSAPLANGAYLGAGNWTIDNCVVYDCNNTAILCTDSSSAIANVTARNTTVINSTGTGFGHWNGGTFTAKNCYAGNCTPCYDSVVNKTNCASSDDTGSPGLQNIACSTSSGAYFASVTDGAEDAHIGGLSALRNAGIDLSSDASFGVVGDIDSYGSKQRPGTWDIGADEYAWTGASVLTLTKYRFRNDDGDLGAP